MARVHRSRRGISSGWTAAWSKFQSKTFTDFVSPTEHLALRCQNFPFHNLFSAIPYFLHSPTRDTLLFCSCVGERPMKSINPISVRRLTVPLPGPESLWAFDYFQS